MNSYLDEHFPNLKIEKPLFYNWPIGLRFEIGPDEIELCEEYFETAHKRAVTIFEFVFSQGDEIEIIYQQYSDGRKKIRKGNFIYKQISLKQKEQVHCSDIRDIYELEYKCECWKRLNIFNLKIEDIDYKNILLSLVNTDFGSRKPSMRGECYFINRTKSVILNLYDDRGMDVISATKESLLPLYKYKNEWLLDYDREKMNSVFS
ncbi:DUF3885 domain-containing protein [Shewanella avicenniae]|uniref:DUF3885 domain-containing protein n=1 Tax=Shewanella avicenniae TaxID=2814294 RepID=A0ABX7QTL5_9GAMM|nr:DUF3885 domain-containing protein [Shewanella avicenniae]QSX34831.1 DUF3885 domain-containing protein [Shewanella avicenniae]